jgi:hypothetical protein
VSGATQAGPRPQAAELALRALGVRCAVEARGNLAVVMPAPGERGLEDTGVRRAVIAALRGQGFTHAALEPGDESPGAPDEPLA